MGVLRCGHTTFHPPCSTKNHPRLILTMKPVSIILVLAVTFSLGNALECHVCSSADNAECNKYDKEGKYLGQGTLKTCPSGQDTYCRKIYQIIRDEESVVRSCGWEEDKVERECYTTVLEEYNTEVCSCRKMDATRPTPSAQCRSPPPSSLASLLISTTDSKPPPPLFRATSSEISKPD